MEAFSLLKYWRGGGVGGGIGGSGVGGGESGVDTGATTIVTSVTHNTVETDDDDDDDGPFFDLEFALPDEDDGEDKEEKKENNGTDYEAQNDDEVESSEDDEEEDADGTDGEREFNFTLSSGSSNDRTDHNLALSPSDDLFFKGRLVPIESSSLVFNGAEANSKPPQFRVSLLKSATKFRVFMLGFKKSKTNTNNNNIAAEKTNEKAEAGGNGSAAAAAAAAAASPTPKQQEESKQNKFFTVKFKVEEVPLVSLFTRENSKSIKSQKQSNNSNNNTIAGEESTASSDDKQRFSKDVMQKYLKKVKPLYIRVSKRYGEKLRFSGQLSLGSGLKTAASPSPSTATASASAPQKSSPVKSSSGENSQPETDSVEAPAASNMKSVKQGNLPAGLRVVCKHLGKSRSASSAAVAAAPPGPVLSRRRDDSLLQQQDGIQSAILHCKKSFNASRESDSSLLSRSVSDPSHEKSLELSRKSSDHEGKKVPPLRNEPTTKRGGKMDLGLIDQC